MNGQPLNFSRACLLLVLATVTLARADENLERWQPVPPDLAIRERTADAVTLQRGQAWGWLQADRLLTDVEVAATLTVDSPATQFDFFGATWSAWPDPRFEDRGFEAAVLLRGSAEGDRGYRVQFSTKYQEVSLVRFPDGGYLRSVACPLPPQTPHRVRVAARGSVLRVWVDDRLVIEHGDRREPALRGGVVALGAASNARVTFSQVTLEPRDPEVAPEPPPHQPHFTVRRWLGERLFVFDHDEPILQLHAPQDPSLFAKLRPGYKPQLTFDSHWGLENQGAFPDALCEWTPPETTGEGDSVGVRWSARHRQGRFVTRSTLRVGYDPRRLTYTYDVDSELEVLPGEPYFFKSGFDFEHHTPLDPFRWNYLLIRNREGQLTYRPLSPFDPGPLADIETYQGLRVWHGRTGDDHEVSPAVEYRIRPEWHRQEAPNGELQPRRLNTAVCAAFYDTGVAFEAATVRPGEKIQVQYRYTGYPAAETRQLFEQARVESNPRIDPRHHFVFAREQWPTLRFTEALPMDRPWWGGRPFLTAHNARPTYDWTELDGEPALRLGPVSYALAPIGPAQITPGRMRLTARVQSRGIQGPGGRIEILFLKKPDPHGNGFVRLDPGNIIGEETRFLGTASSAWRDVSFVFQVPPNTGGLALGLGNGGTGEVFVSQISFEDWGDRPAPAETTLTQSPASQTLPQTLWDLRMEEGQGLWVYNHGSSSYRVAELANIDWEPTGERPALRFRENPRERAEFPALGLLDQWLRNPSQRRNYENVSHGAFVLAGHHGGGEPLRGLTLAAWIRPAGEMGRGEHPGRGDILGYGARRFILALQGQTAPYRLLGQINVKDRLEASTELQADRWYHVAMTCEPRGDQWQIRLYLDGQPVAEGPAPSLPVDQSVPDSLVLGSEYFYLHTHYFRGLLGRTLVIGRVCTAQELQALAQP